MKQLGLKRLLLISVMLLVGLSVSISSSFMYFQEKSTLTKNIISESQLYAEAKANVIANLINDKVGGIDKLAHQFSQTELTGSKQELIDTTFFLANAMNLNSAVIAFENGDAYWNQTAPSWPDHKFAGDVTSKPWYQAGRKAANVTVTEPYQGEGGYWITVIEKIKAGAIMVDINLEFLNEIVTSSTDIPGATAVILNHDGTFLASSSKAVKAGANAADYPWFKSVAQQAIGQKSATTNYMLNGQEKILFSHQIKAGDKNWYFAIGLDKSVAFAPLVASRNSAISIALLMTLISVAIAFTVIQILYRPILSLKQTILDLSSGDADLTQRLQVKTHDDLGQISQGVNQFIEKLQSMILAIQQAASSLDSNVTRMREHSQRNNTILQNHVAETEQVVTAIEEMNATADAMAQDAANTAELTHKANETSIESRKIVEQSQETVSALIDNVEHSSTNVHKMSDETESINQILNVIGDIAEQTNLLALNAAIEAARAGEQGRGFAVVSDEVRNLASRTKNSTAEVEAALSSLVKGTQVVVDSMDSTKQRCQETASGAGNVAESLGVMTNFVDDINDLSTQIATAAEEQSSVTQELSRNMTAINDIVVELDGNGQKALADTDNIAQINQQLVSIVSQFKV